MTTMTTAGQRAGARDPRLDAWRGIAMLIIYIAHIQWNDWSDYIPARYGPSDAAEMFVLCSGYAAGIAFGGTFAAAGFWIGTGRILLRCWQIYWAHLGLFFTLVAVTAAMTALLAGEGRDYYGGLNLGPFLDDPAGLMLGLFTLTYVPNYFDILPMYMVILLLTPVVVALQRLSTGAAAAFCLLLYAAAWAGLDLSAEPWSDRTWYFNPFAWQILFFTGFSLQRRWLRPPPARRPLLLAALAFVLLMVPLSRWQIYEAYPRHQGRPRVAVGAGLQDQRASLALPAHPGAHLPRRPVGPGTRGVAAGALVRARRHRRAAGARRLSR